LKPPTPAALMGLPEGGAAGTVAFGGRTRYFFPLPLVPQ